LGLARGWRDAADAWDQRQRRAWAHRQRLRRGFNAHRYAAAERVLGSAISEWREAAWPCGIVLVCHAGYRFTVVNPQRLGSQQRIPRLNVGRLGAGRGLLSDARLECSSGNLQLTS
jgi:hypothetical protein